ncbi:MAG: hypothetical protein M3096_10130, partial [Actinomycetia bacterium]|nr:hypothetical protein [Actinomycetes bacterium]
DIALPDRDGVRTPMQWDSSSTGGWSGADPDRFYLPVITDEVYGTRSVNVEDQIGDESSPLHALRSMIDHRPQAFGTAPFETIETGDDAVLAYARGRYSVVANFSPDQRTVAVESVEKITGPGAADGTTVVLPPFGWAWLVARA